jgi:hypothetical protein
VMDWTAKPDLARLVEAETALKEVFNHPGVQKLFNRGVSTSPSAMRQHPFLTIIIFAPLQLTKACTPMQHYARPARWAPLLQPFTQVHIHISPLKHLANHCYCYSVLTLA